MLHFAAGRLTGLSAGAEIAGGDGRRLLTSAGRAWSCPENPDLPFRMAVDLDGGLALELTVEQPEDRPGLLLTLALHNRGADRVRIHRLFPLLFDAESALSLSVPTAARERRWGVYKQGYQSWSFAGWLPLDGSDRCPRFFLTRPVHGDPSWPLPGPGRFQSEGMLLLGREGAEPVLLAGFVEGRRMFGRFELTASPPSGGGGSPIAALQAWCEADGIALDPGETLTAEPLLVVAGAEGEALDAYAGLVAGRMGARVPDRSPVVWCSWYGHGARVREVDLIDATVALQARRESHPVDVIQLDDGYMQAVGDWLTCNSRFPHGLGWLANQIRQAGFQPGLWLAPFIAQRRSLLFQQHPDWFVKGVDGLPIPVAYHPDWSDRYYALDLTHPEVQAWLDDLIRRLVRLRFRYLKLDFLFAGAVPGFRYDPQVTRVTALRTGLEIIRRAAGEETFLLGCGCPMLPAVGLVDAMRIGPDTAPSWRFRFKGLPVLQDEPGLPAAKHALRNALARQWMQGRLWLNDPDAQILRESQTSLSAEQVKTLLLTVAMTGGLLSFGDNPDRLSPDRLEWLRRAIPPARPWLQPVSFLHEEAPFLSAGRQGPFILVLAVNGGDRPRPFHLTWTTVGLEPQTPCHMYDCWEGRYLGTRRAGFDGGLLPAHGSRLLALRPVGDLPEPVGTTFHLSPAQVFAAEVRQDGMLILHLGEGTRGRGHIVLSVPPLRQIEGIEAEGANLQARRSGPNDTMVLDLTASPGAVIRIAYR